MENNEISFIIDKVPAKIVEWGVFVLCIFFILLFVLAVVIKIPIKISCEITFTNDLEESKRISILVDNYYSKYFNIDQAIKLRYTPPLESDTSLIIQAQIKSKKQLNDQESVLTLFNLSRFPGINEHSLNNENHYAFIDISLLTVFLL